MIADLLGRPIVLHLTPRQRTDIAAAPELIRQAGTFRRLIADRAYDADRFRSALRAIDVIPVLPGRCNRKQPNRYDKRRYKERWRIEATFGRLKDFRGIATRYDKLARIFLVAVTIAPITAFWL